MATTFKSIRVTCSFFDCPDNGLPKKENIVLRNNKC